MSEKTVLDYCETEQLMTIFQGRSALSDLILPLYRTPPPPVCIWKILYVYWSWAYDKCGKTPNLVFDRIELLLLHLFKVDVPMITVATYCKFYLGCLLCVLKARWLSHFLITGRSITNPLRTSHCIFDISIYHFKSTTRYFIPVESYILIDAIIN